MELHIHNTLSGVKERFEPADPNRVTMYVCGPTVYNRPHIGNGRPAVVFDVLFRVLRHLYGEDHVVYARNITDVDDKINAAAHEAGVPISDITDKYTAYYHADMGALGVMQPSAEPRATAHISQIIQMVEALVAKNHAYAADGHVLFDVSSFEAYGALAKRDMDDMIAGARVEVAPYKRNPADFVLWKPSDDDLPGWDSPWGRGRPGWHIECSAMIEAVLGRTIDIHGGGHDLTFPHHENEIAQGTCAHDGETYVRYWMHNGFVNMGKDKMSKSLGNISLVEELLEQAPGEALRFALLSAHYRQPLEWTDSLIDQAKRTLDRLYGALNSVCHIKAADVPPADDVTAALLDDLNTPKALAALSATAKALNSATSNAEQAALKGALVSGGLLLGLLQADPADWLKGGQYGSEAVKIEALIEKRNTARAEKDFATADQVRDELSAMGVVLKDGPDGTEWQRAS